MWLNGIALDLLMIYFLFIETFQPHRRLVLHPPRLLLHGHQPRGARGGLARPGGRQHVQEAVAGHAHAGQGCGDSGRSKLLRKKNILKKKIYWKKKIIKLFIYFKNYKIILYKNYKGVKWRESRSLASSMYRKLWLAMHTLAKDVEIQVSYGKVNGKSEVPLYQGRISNACVGCVASGRFQPR